MVENAQNWLILPSPVHPSEPRGTWTSHTVQRSPISSKRKLTRKGESIQYTEVYKAEKRTTVLRKQLGCFRNLKRRKRIELDAPEEIDEAAETTEADYVFNNVRSSVSKI